MAKEFKRTDRIGELIQRELARLIQLNVQDPRITLVSVYAVHVTRDLAYAKVYVSRYGEIAEIEACVAALNKAAGYLRTQLAQHIHLRKVPQLLFVYDKTVMEGNRITSLIDKVAPKDPPSDEN